MNTPSSLPKDTDDIDLLEVFATLWRGKWTILFFSILTGMAGVYYALEVAKPKYWTQARLVLQVNSQQLVDIESVVSGVSTEDQAINTELEIVVSRGLIKRLVADLNLVEDPEFNALLRDPPLISRDTIVEGFRTILNLPKKEAAPLTEEEIELNVIEAVQGAIAVSAKPNTYIYSINVKTEGKLKSARIANRLAEIYLDDQIQVKFATTEFAVNWLSGRVSTLEAELFEKEDAIKALRAETELVSLQALEGLNIRAKDIRERVEDTQEDVTTALAKAARVEALTADADYQALAEEYGDPALNRLVADLNKSTIDPAFQSAEIQTKTARILARLTVLRAQDKAVLDRAVSQSEALQLSYAQILERIEEQNNDLVTLNQLVREADATKVLYETFLARLKETSVQIGLQRADSRILSEAVPGEQVEPRRTMILAVSVALGGLIGIAILVLRQFLHNGFRSSEELEKFTGRPVIGQIPVIPIRRRSRLMTYLVTKPTSAAAEAIRNLRTSVLLSDIDNPPK